MSLSAMLESFDTSTLSETAVATKAMPDAGYDKGYADGMAAAEWAAQEAQDRLREAVVQALSDQMLTVDDAQAQLLQSMSAMVEDVFSVMLPPLLAPALHASVCGLVNDLLAETPRVPLTLTVAPDQVAPIKAAIAGAATDCVAVIADEALTDHAVWAAQADREVMIDLDAAHTALLGHIANLTSATLETMDHG